jgi:hypothetical protein
MIELYDRFFGNQQSNYHRNKGHQAVKSAKE